MSVASVALKLAEEAEHWAGIASVHPPHARKLREAAHLLHEVHQNASGEQLPVPPASRTEGYQRADELLGRVEDIFTSLVDAGFGDEMGTAANEAWGRVKSARYSLSRTDEGPAPKD